MPQEQLVQGVRVVLQTTAPFARAPDFDSRVQSTVDAALRYWGGSWGDLNGRTITLVDDPYVECSHTTSLGCFDGNIRLTTRDPAIGTFSCIEATVLVHEIGHAVLGDPDHTGSALDGDGFGRCRAERPGRVLGRRRGPVHDLRQRVAPSPGQPLEPLANNCTPAFDRVSVNASA